MEEATEAGELMARIFTVIEELNCEVIRKDVRIRESRGRWSVDIRLSIRPIITTEEVSGG